MNSILTLDDFVHFSWDFGRFFILQTGGMNEEMDPVGGDFWVWSDPDYGGDNTIVRADNHPAYISWSQKGITIRDKGWHKVREYCGENVKIIP